MAEADLNLKVLHQPRQLLIVDAESILQAVIGNAQAKKNKGIIVEDMTVAQIEAAQEMSRTLLKKYPSLLNR